MRPQSGNTIGYRVNRQRMRRDTGNSNPGVPFKHKIYNPISGSHVLRRYARRLRDRDDYNAHPDHSL